MPFDLSHAASVFMGFLAIMNPIANVPIFLGLTGEEPERSMRPAIAARGLLTAFVIITVFAFSGQALFQLFGITLPAFRITGGILVGLIGYQMLHGEQSKVHQDTTSGEDSREAALSVAISPLAMPILAGPGTIATAMSFAASGGLQETLVTVGSFGVLCVITYVLFVFGERMVSFLGDSALSAITRLMGLILAVIGVQMLVDGISGVVDASRS